MTQKGLPYLQEDIDEVNKIAHGLKARLDALARMNEAALKRPVCYPCATDVDQALLHTELHSCMV